MNKALHHRFFNSWLRALLCAGALLVAAAADALEGDVNQDGQVDVADLVCCVNMVAGRSPADPLLADMDGNGSVDDLDLALLRERILGPDDTVRVEVAATTVGPGGGVVAGDGVAIEIPAGGLPTARTVAVHELPEVAPFGDDGGGPTFELSGLGGRQSEVAVRLHLPGGAAGGEQIMIGEWNWPKSVSQPVWTYRLVEPDAFDGEWAVVALPLAAAGRSPTRASSSGDFGIEGDTIRLKLAREVADETGVHFKIHYPKSVSQAAAEDIRLALERGLAAFETTYSLSTTARTSWPVDVYLLKGFAYAGACADSIWGVNSDYINLKSDDLASEPDRVRTAATHELMHLIQLMYYDNDNLNLWLDEATAVFGEIPGSTTPGYKGWRYDENMARIFDEWHKESGYIWGYSDEAVEYHGYGLSGIFRHLAGRSDTSKTFIHSLYTRIAGGNHPMTALIDSVTAPFTIWRHELFEEFLTKAGYIPLLTPPQALSATPKITIQNLDDLAAGFAQSMTLKDLDAEVVDVAIDPALLAPDAALRAHLTGADGHLMAFRRDLKDISYLGAGATAAANEWFIDIPDIKPMFEPFQKITSQDRYRSSLHFLVLNNHRSAGYDGQGDFNLQFSVAQPYDFIARQFKLLSISINNYDVMCPEIATSGRFKGAFTRSIEDQLGVGSEEFRDHSVWVKLAKPLPQTIHLELKVQNLVPVTRIGRDEKIEGTLGNLYLFEYLTWDELDLDNLASARIVGAGGIDITVTEAKPVFYATAYVMVHYVWTWGTVSQTFDLLRPVFSIQFYATDNPHYMPNPFSR